MLSSTRPSDEEVESITGLQYPTRDSFKYYAGSAGIEDPNTDTGTLPDADSSSIKESILTRPPTPGPSNPHPLIQHFSPEPFEKNTNKPESLDPHHQPTTLSLFETGNTANLANQSPRGGMTPMSCQLHGILARSTNKPGSEEWSQEPDSPYGLLLEGLDLLGLPPQLTQMEVNEKYQRRFKERYLNSIRELVWWRTPMGRLYKEADMAGEGEEVEVIRWYDAHMQATLLFNEDYPNYALPEMLDYMPKIRLPGRPSKPTTSRLLARAGGGEAGPAHDFDEESPTGPDKGKASKQRPLMVEDLRRLGLLKLKDKLEKTPSKRDDLWSLPKPLDRGLPPDPLPQPTRQGSEDAKYWQVQLTLIQEPALFKGAHKDLKRFLMDCLMYFKTFSSYFVYDAQKVVFAASHFNGNMKEWWSQRSQEYLSREGPAYQFPDWNIFIIMMSNQFANHALRETYLKKMNNLKMRDHSAPDYFNELEHLAKLAS
ncbi:hypothetical protein IW262DRAFT_1468492 [Armillaria fumosa]|nr:hypothetical protein IW262DRAFT_1468492 [Armillaria fumosa]